jgi:hypothetical protein
LPQARDQQRYFLQMEGQVRRPGSVCCQRLKTLEDENAKLKKLLAEAMLRQRHLKDIASKNW